MDFVSISKEGEYKSALLVCDLLTKRIRVFPMQQELGENDNGADEARTKACAEATARLFFDGIWKHHGLPDRIVSDRDPRFMSAFWQTLWKLLRTDLNVSTAGYAQTDGQSERSIRTFVTMLRAYVRTVGRQQWATLVPALEYAYNDSVHAATGYTPFQLEYGQDPHSPLQLWLAQTDSAEKAEETEGGRSARSLVNSMRDALVAARKTIRAHQETYTAYQNKSRDLKTTIAPGDWVWVENQDKRNKLDPLYVGPFRVTRVRGRVVTFARSGRRFAKVNLHKVRKYEVRAGHSAAVASSLRVSALLGDDEPVQHLQVCSENQWMPVLQFLRMHQERGLVALQPLLDALDLDRTLTTGAATVGTRVSHRLRGQGMSDGIIVEFDAADLDYAYRVAFPDDEADWSEREMLTGRRAYLARLGASGSQLRAPEPTAYEVDFIVDHKRGSATQAPLFRVRWKGYAAKHDTWEPLEQFRNASVDALDHVAIAAYLSKQGLKPRDLISE